MTHSDKTKPVANLCSELTLDVVTDSENLVVALGSHPFQDVFHLFLFHGQTLLIDINLLSGSDGCREYDGGVFWPGCEWRG